MAPLNGSVCGRACLGSYESALVPEAVGLIEKNNTGNGHAQGDSGGGGGGMRRNRRRSSSIRRNSRKEDQEFDSLIYFRKVVVD